MWPFISFERGIFVDTLKKNYQFKIVYKKGKSIANRQMVMYVYPNKTEENFLGISVSKKVGNSVVRSRVTRLLKESVRLNEDKIKTGYDIVIIARNSIKGIGYFEVEKSLIHLLKKHNLYAK